MSARALLAVFALLGPATGQEEFDRLYAEAQALQQTADPTRATELRDAWGAALRAFLQIPPNAPGYATRVLAGSEAALGAGRNGMALELVAEAIARDGQSDAHLTVQLGALLATGDAEAFLSTAAGHFPEALGAALQHDWQQKGRLLGWADQWLRGARTEEALWLFEQLASGGDPRDLANLALARRHAGRTAASEQAYRRALEAAPDDAVIWNDYGLFLKGDRRAEEALLAFRQSYVLEAVPGEGAALTNLLALAVFRPDLVPEPPLDEAAEAFSVRAASADLAVARAAMLRRVTLDVLLAGGQEPFPASDPDRRAIRR